jgi:hypothetical protein
MEKLGKISSRVPSVLQRSGSQTTDTNVCRKMVRVGTGQWIICVECFTSREKKDVKWVESSTSKKRCIGINLIPVIVSQ